MSIRSAARLLFVLGSVSTTAAAEEFRLESRTFTVPDGLVVELVASSPLVDRPIVAAIDQKGRLYVADSSGSNEKPSIQLEKRPHKIIRLEDVDGDGKYDRRTVFADRMMFPSGAMWLDGSLYVSTPPSIWKLTDTDGDGVADVRVEWFKGKTLTGCANDLHGPYRGPDGWIYWTKGAFAEQTYPRTGKPPFVTKAAHIFRARPDGSGIEPVMTGGMDNPVDVVFTNEGERLFTTTFLQHPEGGKRDGIIHAVYGGVYGKIPGVVRRRQRSLPPHRLRLRRILDHPAQRRHQLQGVIGLEHDRIPKSGRVVLAGRTGHRQPAGGHHLEANQSEGLVPRVGDPSEATASR